MRVALYLRMSTDAQEGSIAQQEKALLAHCRKHGYHTTAVYKDEGISGDATDKRKQFLRMIGDAPSGLFERILCWDQDRFGRFDMLEAGVYVTPLRKAGVSLETLAQGVIDWEDFGGRVIYGIAQEGKHQYLRDLSRNVLRGLQAKAIDCRGYPGGPAPFGYCRVTELVAVGGKSKRVSRLEIVEADAAIVRRLFAEYVRPNASANLVAQRLARDGVKSPRGAPYWKRENIARILQCPAYVGIVQWGKHDTGKYAARTPEGGVVSRKGSAKRASVGAIRHHRPDICPPIVDQATFDEAQRLLAERGRSPCSPSAIRPLSGIIYCSRCGKRMHADGRRREGTTNKGEPSFRCSSSIVPELGKPCLRSRIPEAPLLDAIQAKLDEFLGTRRGVAELTRRAEALVRKREGSGGEAAVQSLSKRLTGIEKRLADGIARLTVVPDGLVPELSRALDGLRQERDAAAADLASAKAETTRGGGSTKDVVSAMVKHYGSMLKARDQGKQALTNHFLRKIGCEIRIDKEGPKLVAEVKLISMGDSYRASGCPIQVPTWVFCFDSALT